MFVYLKLGDVDDDAFNEQNYSFSKGKPMLKFVHDMERHFPLYSDDFDDEVTHETLYFDILGEHFDGSMVIKQLEFRQPTRIMRLNSEDEEEDGKYPFTKYLSGPMKEYVLPMNPNHHEAAGRVYLVSKKVASFLFFKVTKSDFDNIAEDWYESCGDIDEKEKIIRYDGFFPICKITHNVLWNGGKYDESSPRAVAVMMWFKLRVLIKSSNAIMYWNELVHRPKENNLKRLFSEL
tara:strand:- start:3397 stop:4101 length:705 start_codon:yes stop_codon:yes gene_type:complete